MSKFRCPCCGEWIEVQGASASCIGSSEETVPKPKEGPFFDKTMHPPTLTRQAHESEQERFKRALGELPKGSAGAEEIDEGADLPEVEEPTYERNAQGKPIIDVSKLISEEEDDD